MASQLILIKPLLLSYPDHGFFIADRWSITFEIISQKMYYEWSMGYHFWNKQKFYLFSNMQEKENEKYLPGYNRSILYSQQTPVLILYHIPFTCSSQLLFELASRLKQYHVIMLSNTCVMIDCFLQITVYLKMTSSSNP